MNNLIISLKVPTILVHFLRLYCLKHFLQFLQKMNENGTIDFQPTTKGTNN